MLLLLLRSTHKRCRLPSNTPFISFSTRSASTFSAPAPAGTLLDRSFATPLLYRDFIQQSLYHPVSKLHHLNYGRSVDQNADHLGSPASQLCYTPDHHPAAEWLDHSSCTSSTPSCLQQSYGVSHLQLCAHKHTHLSPSPLQEFGYFNRPSPPVRRLAQPINFNRLVGQIEYRLELSRAYKQLQVRGGGEKNKVMWSIVLSA